MAEQTDLAEQINDIIKCITPEKINERSEKLIAEIHEHVKEVHVDCPDAGSTDITMGWMLQKIASLQLVAEAQEAQIQELTSEVGQTSETKIENTDTDSATVYIDVKEVCSLLDISVSTLYRLRKQHADFPMPADTFLRGTLKYAKRDILNWIKNYR